DGVYGFLVKEENELVQKVVSRGADENLVRERLERCWMVEIMGYFCCKVELCLFMTKEKE
uniref:hypothetical protein n=1 Tax=Siminovitchia fortis TaxID=254758 RepID=UPI001C92C003